jgi:hypothetical protein
MSSNLLRSSKESGANLTSGKIPSFTLPTARPADTVMGGQAVALLPELSAGQLVEPWAVEAQSKACTDRSDPREQPASGVAEIRESR